MRAALVAELRKLLTTRIWWLLLIVMVAYLAFVAAVVAASLTVLASGDAPAPLAGEDAARATYSLVNSVGYVFPLVIGSLVMTSEFRHRTVTQSLLADPDRTRFLVAKLAAVVPVGLLAGVLGIGAVVAGGAPLLIWQGDGAHLGDPDVLLGLFFGVLVVAVWAVIGVAVGSVLSNQVAAVVVILVFTQFVEPILRLVFTQVDALSGAASWLPGGAADSLIGATFLGDPATADLLPRWAAALVLLGYAAALSVAGRLTTLRRDIG